MDLNKLDYYDEKYQRMSELLLNFLEDTYYPERTDEDTIKKCIKKWNIEFIKETIKQGKAVLALDPFPWEWIYSVCGYKSLFHILGNSKEAKYFNWVEWMMKALEEEAKKARKL